MRVLVVLFIAIALCTDIADAGRRKNRRRKNNNNNNAAADTSTTVDTSKVEAADDTTKVVIAAPVEDKDTPVLVVAAPAFCETSDGKKIAKGTIMEFGCFIYQCVEEEDGTLKLDTTEVSAEKFTEVTILIEGDKKHPSKCENLRAMSKLPDIRGFILIHPHQLPCISKCLSPSLSSFTTNQELTDKSKQPIRTRYLGYVTGYQLIRDQYFIHFFLLGPQFTAMTLWFFTLCVTREVPQLP
eukprot:sb/3469065/